MATPSLSERVAQLYNKIGDEQRLPYKLSHARQPNVSEPHNHQRVIAYGKEHVSGFFDRAARAVKHSEKSREP
jgi:hypothetical protein